MATDKYTLMPSMPKVDALTSYINITPQ